VGDPDQLALVSNKAVHEAFQLRDRLVCSVGGLATPDAIHDLGGGIPGDNCRDLFAE
jgi:hypothetical protein